jgi:uncharacterized protein YndB with AHSA1/START domain
MPVIDITTDPRAATLTLTAEFAAAVERVWQLWADPRQLERWWGPPGYPATFVEHGIAPGDRVRYYMTGPDGARHGGWWRILEADPPRGLTFEDGFADADGRPIGELPTSTGDVRLAEAGGRTRMVIVTGYESQEAMEQVLAMGMEEGIRAAVNQIDDLLAGVART